MTGPPERPFEAVPVVPAPAARGVSPDAPAAAPAKYLLGLSLLSLLYAAAPVAAAQSLQSERRQAAPVAQRRAEAPPAERPKRAGKVVLKGTAGAGSFFELRRIAPELLP